MKSSSLITRCILPVIGLALLSFAQAQGQVVNVQFTDGSNDSGSAGAVLNGNPWSSIVSPLAYTGTTWTSGFASSATDLSFSDGSSSTIGYTLAAQFTTTNGGSNQAGQQVLTMFTEAAGTGGGNTILTINGLQNGLAYDIYLDSAFNNNGGSAFTIGSQTQGTTGAINSGSFISGVNFVEFAGINPIDNSIVVTISPSNPGGFSLLDGFQITEAPEPNSLLMMGLGAVILFAAVSRKRLVTLWK